jgi:WD40 repeat protein
MTDTYLPEEIPTNDRALNKLIRAITMSQGNFSLILARCNYGSLRDRVVQQLQSQCPISIHKLHLPSSTKTLYTTIQAELGHEQVESLMIFGLEQVDAINQVLISTNQVREEFRKQFLFPIVLWVNDDILKRIIQLMPDFKSWTGNSIKFEITPTELAESLKQPTDQLFEAIFAVGEGKFLKLAALHPQGDHLSRELQTTLEDLQAAEDRLTANLQFWVGREADLRGEKEQAKANYEKSVAFWVAQINSPDSLSSEDWARYGCVLFHLGLWWRQYATQHRAEYEVACLQAKDFYQQSLAAFDRTNRPELAAKFINALGEVLTRIGAWNELATVAHRAVSLHQTYPEPIRLAFAYGLLAEVALQQHDWSTLGKQAELALQTNELPSTSSIDWTQDCAQRKNFYLLLLAQSQRHLKDYVQAIANLETAKANFHPQYDPTVYIRILEALRSLYFEQGQYLQAFETKQEQRSIEQQFGLRAFVGAGRLQSRRQVINPGLAAKDIKAAESQEIAASGRGLDVNRLLERISRTDHKLTVIYGQSGVGKSSLVQAGLVPALKQRLIDARDVVPVLLQVYTDWAQSLGDRLAESLQEVQGLSLPLFLDSMVAFVAEIQKSDDKNLLTVLIFDQFEEFFFAYKDPSQRRPFFEFLRDCLNVPYVKVILSLREDYLHYLLECNRLTHLDVIDNNILDKKILYYLGNFSPEDGRAVIQSLTNACQYSLEPVLIDELVRDLAGDLNEVRPIELQVVGAQMQTEQVTTLAKYLADGPKERFVGRFLEEVVADCGTNNEQFAKIVLYLLTDDNQTRPLKTRAELEAELAIEPERLGLILNILVKSGLVFQVPGFPADRYQLVHDYLVPFVRQQQAAGLVAELEKEREQRKLTEERLNQALKQQLKTARRGILTLLGLTVAIGGFAIVAIVAGINLYIANQVGESSKNTELDKLVSAIKVGKTLKALPVAIREVSFPALVEINNAIINSRELNRLEGHKGAVNQAIFSNDSKLLASIGEDKTAKVWRVSDGKLLQTIEGSQKKIASISFSPDGQKIATGVDREVKIWTVGGEQLHILPTKGIVGSISFSPDNGMIAISVGKEVVFWDLVTKTEIFTYKGGDAEITSVSFSPDGKMIAIADNDDNVRILNLKDKKVLYTINNYGTIGIRFDQKMLVLTNKDRSVKYYNFDGTLVKNVAGYYYRPITTAALSPDSKLLATATKDDYDISLISTETRQEFPSFSGHKDIINSLSFSPDGKILASACKDGTIRLWAIDVKSRFMEDAGIKKIQFGSDNQTIAAALSDGTVQIFDQQFKTIQTPKVKVNGSVYSFSPDIQKFVTNSTDDVIKLWNMGGQEITLKSQSNGINFFNISPNGKTVVSIGNDDTLRFWRNDGTLIKPPEQLGSKSSSIIYSPNSKMIALKERNKVQLWLSDGTRLGNLTGHISQINEVSISPDSEMIATRGDDNLINLWSKDGTLINILRGHNNEIGGVEFSPDSQKIASFSQPSFYSRGEIKLWDRDGNLINTFNGYSIQEILFSPDNQTIAAINRDGTIQLLDIAGNQISSLPYKGTVTNLSFSPDSKMIASASDDNLIRLWHRSGELIQTLRGHSSRVNQLKFNPIDGQTIISASNDGMVMLWKRDGTRLKILQPASEGFDPEKDFSINRINFSDDGKIIIFNRSVDLKRDNKRWQGIPTKIWNNDGNPLENPKGQLDVDSVTSSSDGKSVAWVEHDKNLKLFDLRDSSQTRLSGHQANVNSASFSQDGTVLATASDDKTVILWNTLDGRLLKKFDNNIKVRQVSFSPLDNVLAAVGDDKAVKFWNLEGQVKSPLSDADKIIRIQFSPDGKILGSFTQDSKFTMSQMSNGKNSGVFEGTSITAFNRDSTILAIAYENGTIRFFLMHRLFDPIISLPIRSNLTDMQFSPDGKMMALTAYGNKPMIVDFDLDRLLRKACHLSRNYLQNSQNNRDRHLCDDIK